MKRIPLVVAGALLAAIPGLAGPPLICHPIEIGSARSLPWRTAKQWDGRDPGYNVARLTDDTLALLAPAMPVNVRMETLRRAALYSARDAARAAELSGRLMARALASEAGGKPDPLAWFDAGYFVETLRQAVFVYRYNMLSPAERAAWQLRGGVPIDGYPWVQRAVRLGGTGMGTALASMEGYRRADQETRPASTRRASAQ